MKEIEVVTAIIMKDGKFFCAKRPDKGVVALKWEFPGGKMEENETREAALAREIKEEINIDIDVKEYFMTVKTQYKGFDLTMHSFLCEINSGEIKLNEHVDSKWLRLEELDCLDWAQADVPIVAKLEEKF